MECRRQNTLNGLKISVQIPCKSRITSQKKLTMGPLFQSVHGQFQKSTLGFCMLSICNAYKAYIFHLAFKMVSAER